MQKSEWLKWRKIGSSDAPIIMGVSPWTTPYKLWEMKLTGEQRADNTAMARGRANEEPARLYLENMTGMIFDPLNVESEDYEFMTASLDGYDERHRIITEIKNPGEKDHATAAHGKIPEKYWPQLQHQLCCKKDAEKLIYFSYFKRGKDVDVQKIEVVRDPCYIDKMVKVEAEFWDLLRTQTPPNKACKDAPYDTPNDGMLNLFIELQAIQKKMNEGEHDYKRKKKELEEMANGKHIKFPDGSIFYSSLPKGRVQYDQIPELHGVNLDLYRAQPKLQWTLRFNK